MSASRVDHFGGSPVSLPVTVKHTGVRVRSKKGGDGKELWNDTVPSPLPPGSRKNTCVWEGKPDGNTQDVLWDEKESVWWKRDDSGGLYKFDMGGSAMTRVGEGALKGSGRVCINTKLGLLVTTDNNRVTCMRRSGEVVKEFTVPGCGWLEAITYCPHRDIYVVSDTGKHGLWFIDSNSCHGVQQLLGSQGSGKNLYSLAYFIFRQTVNPDTCHIIVSDNCDHCIKVYTLGNPIES